MSKKYLAIPYFTVLAILFFSWNSYATDLTLNGRAKVYFSPNGGATQATIKEINDAKSEILVQSYSFSSSPIAKALVDAGQRGVHVEAILDKSQKKEKYTEAIFPTNMNISTYIDDKHAMAHNSIMIIDQSTVITGSFNFTKTSEEKNAENLLVIRSKDLAKVYIDNWALHKEHSKQFERKQPAPGKTAQRKK